MTRIASFRRARWRGLSHAIRHRDLAMGGMGAENGGRGPPYVDKIDEG